MKKDAFYYLTFEDIQTVATQELGRKLNSEEIETIKNDVPNRINWYEAIANTIFEKKLIR